MGEVDARPAKPRPPGSARQVLWIRILTLSVFVSVWQAIALSNVFYEGVFPTVDVIFKGVVSEALQGEFYRDLGVTLFEAILGFIAGAFIAIVLSIWLGLKPFARQAIEPYIVALGGTPKIIFLPILFLLFGLGIESKIAKGALSAFFPVAISATHGFLMIRPVLLQVGKSFGITGWQMATKIYLPAMVGPVIIGARLGIAMAIIGVLAAEISYSDIGIGFRLARQSDMFEIGSMYGTIILLFAVAIAINSSITMLQRRLSRHEAVEGGTLALE